MSWLSQDWVDLADTLCLARTRLRVALKRSRGRARAEGPVAAPYPKLFIVGSPRSGTTWVKRLLQAHPRVVCGPESHAYRQVFEGVRGRLHRGARVWKRIFHVHRTGVTEGKGGIRHYIARKTLHRLVERALLEPASTQEQLDLQAEGLIRGVFDDFHRRHAGGPDDLLLEKTPGHVLCAERILRFYPEAKLAIVLRDGRDVCVSLQMRSLTRLWPPKERREQIELWVRHAEAGLRLLSNPEFEGRVLEVRYEQLLQDPHGELRRLCGFARLRADAEFLRAAVEAAAFANTAQTGPGEHKWRGTAGTWKRYFTDEDRRLFRELAGDVFERAGYSFGANGRS